MHTQCEPLIYADPSMHNLMQTVERIAAADASVLIVGEVGVGKRQIAAQIHRNSRRYANPFMRIDCTTCSESLMAEMLCGDNLEENMVMRANGGILFLDGVHMLSQPLQHTLLRLLRHQSIETMKASRIIDVDVRIIASTDHNIVEYLAKGAFRRDLYYQLNVLSITIPPLRKRVADIVPLIEHFLQMNNETTGHTIAGFSKAAHKMLMHYYWPGNVQELKNVIHDAVIKCDGNVIERQDISLSTAMIPCLKEAMLTHKREILRYSLECTSWNRTETARLLGIQRTYLSKLIRTLNIKR